MSFVTSFRDLTFAAGGCRADLFERDDLASAFVPQLGTSDTTNRVENVVMRNEGRMPRRHDLDSVSICRGHTAKLDPFASVSLVDRTEIFGFECPERVARDLGCESTL